MKFTLLVPTKDEIGGMKAIMPRVRPEWVDEILVVDGGKDGCYEYALERGYRAIRQRGKGLVGAYREGVAEAAGDVIISFSPDGNSVPELIPELVSKMREGYDMVIASRYLDGAKSEDDDAVTAFGNWMFTRMINLCFGGRYTDTLVMLRAWRKELFGAIEFRVELAGFEPHICIKCAKWGLKTAEIPGDEPARIAGVRKMSPLANGSAILATIALELLSRSDFGKPPFPRQREG